VHALPSSQETGTLTHPPPGEQLSSVQASPSLQAAAVVPQQVLRLHVRLLAHATTAPLPEVGHAAEAPLQTLPTVQTLRSSQAVPAGARRLLGQALVAPSHTSATSQGPL
jgi:hypothetical protein